MPIKGGFTLLDRVTNMPYFLGEEENAKSNEKA